MRHLMIIGQIIQLPSPCCSLTPLVWLKQTPVRDVRKRGGEPNAAAKHARGRSPPGPHAQTGVRKRNRTPPDCAPSRWVGRSWAGPDVRGPSLPRRAQSERRSTSCDRRSVRSARRRCGRPARAAPPKESGSASSQRREASQWRTQAGDHAIHMLVKVDAQCDCSAIDAGAIGLLLRSQAGWRAGLQHLRRCASCDEP